MKDSQYLNADGTFKGGFEGCVLHMTQVEGHDKEAATRICGYINAHKMGNRDLPFLNRDNSGAFTPPADGFYHIVPKGEYFHPESGLLQVIDEAALTAIANRFTQESQTSNFPGLLVDFEHFSYDTNQSSSAAGWITELQNRNDGLWGRIRWSDQGDAAIKNGRYRLISPVWLPKDVQQLGNKRVRPLRLDTAGLTNNPNLRGMVPLSNRSGSNDPAEKPQTQTPIRMKSLCTALGLSADASEEAALAELNKLKNRATAAEQALEPEKNRVKAMETEVAQLKNRNAELTTSVVEQDLIRYGNRIKPESKDKWKAQLVANRAAAIELLEGLPEPKEEATGGNQDKPLHNRSNAKTPEQQPGNQADKNAEKESAKARKIANRAHEIATAQKITYSAAWKMAAGELAGE